MQNAKVNIVMYKNSSSLEKGNIGYVEFLETIGPNNNFQVKIFVTLSYQLGIIILAIVV